MNRGATRADRWSVPAFYALPFATLAALGCHDEGSARAPGPVASTLLALAAELGMPAEDIPPAWAVVERLAAQVESGAWRDRAHDHERAELADRLPAVLFDELHFEREVNEDDMRFALLPSVLAGRRGSCLGLGALYLALAERLGLEAHGVMVPGHFFVRLIEGGRSRNVELLRRGESLPDRWYQDKYGPWSRAASGYLRPLSLQEVVAIHWFNAGNQRRTRGDLGGAERAFDRAVTEFPEFAEALASQGMARQLRGDLTGAADSYQAALRARPDLPGLARNIDVLEREGGRQQNRRGSGVVP